MISRTFYSVVIITWGLEQKKKKIGIQFGNKEVKFRKKENEKKRGESEETTAG